MGWPLYLGWALFIVVPGFLWVAGAIANRGGALRDRLLGFAVGTDGRLSLSRLQAFLWTLVIFGSFAAAMCVHKKITAASPSETQRADDSAKAAAARAATVKSEYDAAETAAKTAASDKAAAGLAAAKDGAAAEARRKEPNQKPEDVTTADKKASESKINAAAIGSVAAEKAHALVDAKSAWDQAKKEAEDTDRLVKSFEWVKIPNTLLTLAGIAVGSGVFSSLIAAMSSEGKKAKITALLRVTKDAAPEGFSAPSNTGDPKNPNYLVLDGNDLGETGSVRLVRKGIGKDLAPVLLWKTDGTQIILDVKDGQSYERIIVDTPNGKLSYKLDGQTPSLVLGPEQSHYEFADLFRDDKHPGTMDLMKFQMFGWTAIAIGIYVYLFLTNLTDSISSLPAVDSSIAILTGVSQAGYLTGKAVSNVPPS